MSKPTETLTIEDLKDTLKLANKDKHTHVVKAIKIQIEEMEQETKEPKQTLKQRMASVFSKRKK